MKDQRIDDYMAERKMLLDRELTTDGVRHVVFRSPIQISGDEPKIELCDEVAFAPDHDFAYAACRSLFRLPGAPTWRSLTSLEMSGFSRNEDGIIVPARVRKTWSSLYRLPLEKETLMDSHDFEIKHWRVNVEIPDSKYE